MEWKCPLYILINRCCSIANWNAEYKVVLSSFSSSVNQFDVIAFQDWEKQSEMEEKLVINFISAFHCCASQRNGYVFFFFAFFNFKTIEFIEVFRWKMFRSNSIFETVQHTKCLLRSTPASVTAVERVAHTISVISNQSKNNTKRNFFSHFFQKLWPFSLWFSPFSPEGSSFIRHEKEKQCFVNFNKVWSQYL